METTRLLTNIWGQEPEPSGENDTQPHIESIDKATGNAA